MVDMAVDMAVDVAVNMAVDMSVDMLVTKGMATVDIAVNFASISALNKQNIFFLTLSMISKTYRFTALKLKYLLLCLQGETRQISSVN
jgi:hypothetical protein